MSSPQLARPQSLARMLCGLCLLYLPTGPAAAQDAVSFELVVEITWSEETAPYEFPDDAHLSNIIGAIHNSRYTLFRDGDTASSGLELVAENGRAKTLRAEFDEAIRRRQISMVVEGSELNSVPGRISTRFEATPDHSLLSFVTMIAPSPDWFTGATDVPLKFDDAWRQTIELTLWAWDSGTDHGATYQAADADTQPQQSIRLVATPHFLTDRGLVPVGRAVIRRLDVDEMKKTQMR